MIEQEVLIKAEVAHLVERDLAKVEVAGSSPVFRSGKIKKAVLLLFLFLVRSETKLQCVYPGGGIPKAFGNTQDLKSCSQQCECWDLIKCSFKNRRIKCVYPGGGTGRHAGLKILFAAMRVTVQFRSRVRYRFS
jgi:hypothetical protein